MKSTVHYLFVAVFCCLVQGLYSSQQMTQHYAPKPVQEMPVMQRSLPPLTLKPLHQLPPLRPAMTPSTLTPSQPHIRVRKPSAVQEEEEPSVMSSITKWMKPTKQAELKEGQKQGRIALVRQMAQKGERLFTAAYILARPLAWAKEQYERIFGREVMNVFNTMISKGKGVAGEFLAPEEGTEKQFVDAWSPLAHSLEQHELPKHLERYRRSINDWMKGNLRFVHHRVLLPHLAKRYRLDIHHLSFGYYISTVAESRRSTKVPHDGRGITMDVVRAVRPKHKADWPMPQEREKNLNQEVLEDFLMLRSYISIYSSVLSRLGIDYLSALENEFERIRISSRREEREEENTYSTQVEDLYKKIQTDFDLLINELDAVVKADKTASPDARIGLVNALIKNHEAYRKKQETSYLLIKKEVPPVKAEDLAAKTGVLGTSALDDLVLEIEMARQQILVKYYEKELADDQFVPYADWLKDQLLPKMLKEHMRLFPRIKPRYVALEGLPGKDEKQIKAVLDAIAIKEHGKIIEYNLEKIQDLYAEKSENNAITQDEAFNYVAKAISTKLKKASDAVRKAEKIYRMFMLTFDLAEAISLTIDITQNSATPDYYGKLADAMDKFVGAFDQILGILEIEAWQLPIDESIEDIARGSWPSFLKADMHESPSKNKYTKDSLFLKEHPEVCKNLGYVRFVAQSYRKFHRVFIKAFVKKIDADGKRIFELRPDYIEAIAKELAGPLVKEVVTSLLTKLLMQKYPTMGPAIAQGIVNTVDMFYTGIIKGAQEDEDEYRLKEAADKRRMDAYYKSLNEEVSGSRASSAPKSALPALPPLKQGLQHTPKPMPTHMNPLQPLQSLPRSAKTTLPAA